MSTAQKVPIEGTDSGPSGAKRVPLAALVFNKKQWPRQYLDDKRVGEFADLYKDEPDRLPPLEVVPFTRKQDKATFEACDCELCQKREKTLPKDAPRYEVAEGWHRGHALLKLKRKDAAIVLLPTGTDPYQYALTTSVETAKPLTLTEKRAAVRRLIEERNKKQNNLSDRQIAKLCGMSNTYVSNQQSWLNRKASAIKDAFSSDGAASGSSTADEWEREWNQSLEAQIVKVLSDKRATTLTVEDMADVWETYPDLRPIARHVASVLYQAAKMQTEREKIAANLASATQSVTNAIEQRQRQG